MTNTNQNQSSKQPPSRHIPGPIRRIVRQRCGFCCVICRCPIYDYEHIADFSVVKEHNVENLTLLCPTCHRKKGKLISRQMIVDATKLRVANVNKLAVTGSESIQPQPYKLDIGGNKILSFAGGCLFQIEGLGEMYFLLDQVPLLSAALLDAAGNAAMEIYNNEFYFSTKVWDTEYVGQTITFRNDLREIFLSVTIDPDDALITLRAKFALENGVQILISNSGIYANDQLLAMGNLIEKSSAGILVNEDIAHGQTGFLSISPKQAGNTTAHNLIIGGDVGCYNIVNTCYNHILECRVGLWWNPTFISEHLSFIENN